MRPEWPFGVPCAQNEQGSLTLLFFLAQGALRDILMPRGKNCLPTVSRQFLTLNYPRPNCLGKCLPNCLSPTLEDIFSSFKIAPVVRVTARQLSGKNCLAAIFASRHQDASPGPLGALWGISLLFFLFPIFLVLCPFSFLFQGFLFLARKEKNPRFFGGFPLLFPKKSMGWMVRG